MPSTKPQINARLTNKEWRALETAMNRAELSKAEFIRTALSNLCALHGVEFPDDMPQHGGKREREIREAMAVADKLTDYGRNDPAESD